MMRTPVKNKTGNITSNFCNANTTWSYTSLTHMYTLNLGPHPCPHFRNLLMAKRQCSFPTLHSTSKSNHRPLSLGDKTARLPKIHRTCSLLHRALCVWQRRGRCTPQQEKAGSRPVLMEISHPCSEEGRNTWQAGWQRTPRVTSPPSCLQCCLVPSWTSKV